jgi:hypothetical protein
MVAAPRATLQQVLLSLLSGGVPPQLPGANSPVSWKEFKTESDGLLAMSMWYVYLTASIVLQQAGDQRLGQCASFGNGNTKRGQYVVPPLIGLLALLLQPNRPCQWR